MTFKTLLTCTGSGIASRQIVTETGIAALKLYPNPSRGQFVIDLRVSDNITGTAKVQLIDITGRTVQTENVVMQNGSLQKTISIFSSLAKGTYMVRIMAADKIYSSILIYEK